LVSRLRLDAALFNEIVEEPVKRRGRKRVKGNKQPTLKQRLNDGSLEWNEQCVTWYGRILKNVKLASALKIRWVVVHNPENNRVDAFFSTDINLAPETIILYSANFSHHICF
jgi:hypothetical protein